jgi:hypothetical protein
VCDTSGIAVSMFVGTAGAGMSTTTAAALSPAATTAPEGSFTTDTWNLETLCMGAGGGPITACSSTKGTGVAASEQLWLCSGVVATDKVLGILPWVPGTCKKINYHILQYKWLIINILVTAYSRKGNYSMITRKALPGESP